MLELNQSWLDSCKGLTIVYSFKTIRVEIDLSFGSIEGYKSLRVCLD
jgi:hypothetical protein